jgi:hypothetical protein
MVPCVFLNLSPIYFSNLLFNMWDLHKSNSKFEKNINGEEKITFIIFEKKFIYKRYKTSLFVATDKKLTRRIKTKKIKCC